MMSDVYQLPGFDLNANTNYKCPVTCSGMEFDNDDGLLLMNGKLKIQHKKMSNDLGDILYPLMSTYFYLLYNQYVIVF